MSATPNITKVPELNRRILITLVMLAIFRLGVFIPTPGIDSEALAGFFKSASGTSTSRRCLPEARSSVSQFSRWA